VTLVGQNWNQLTGELQSWLLLGRDLEDALNNKEKAHLSPV